LGLYDGIFEYNNFIITGIVSVLAMIASLGKRRGPLTHATEKGGQS